MAYNFQVVKFAAGAGAEPQVRARATHCAVRGMSAARWRLSYLGTKFQARARGRNRDTVREDGPVPRLIEPSGQSPEVVTVIELIGSRARTEIVKMLLVDGPKTTSEVARRLEFEHNKQAHHHLVALRDAGYVTSEVIDRRGTLRWTASRENVLQAPQRWVDYVTGADAVDG